MATAEQITLTAPSAEQNASYLRLLQIDRWSFDQRRRGQSGLLTDALRAEQASHSAIVNAALDAGVGFDRMSFGDVQSAEA